MKKIIYILSALFLLTTTVQSVEFKFKKSKFKINASVPIFLGQTVDENGEKTTNLKGSTVGISLKYSEKINKNINIYSKIELESKALNSSENGDVRTDDIIFSIKHKAYGTLSFSKNNDDPVEKYIAEVLDHSEFLGVSEGSTVSSKNNQIQYKTTKFNNFNVIIGLSSPSKSDINKAHHSLVIVYANNNYGFSLGGGVDKDKDKNENGLAAWYRINNITFDVLTFTSKIDSIETKRNGIGLDYKINQKSNVTFVIQKIKKDMQKSHTEKALGYYYDFFKGLTLSVEVVYFDKNKYKDDSRGIGLTYEF